MVSYSRSYVLVLFAAFVARGCDALSLYVRNDSFVWQNGTAFTILAGEMHYSRVHPAAWQDRLVRLRALGLNAVQVGVREVLVAAAVGGAGQAAPVGAGPQHSRFPS
jgi:hypothetical protein